MRLRRPEHLGEDLGEKVAWLNRRVMSLALEEMKKMSLSRLRAALRTDLYDYARVLEINREQLVVRQAYSTICDSCARSATQPQAEQLLLWSCSREVSSRGGEVKTRDKLVFERKASRGVAVVVEARPPFLVECLER